MSTFCTSCGSASTGAAFCTSCGTAMGSVVAPTAVTEEVAQTFTPVSDQTPSETDGDVAVVGNDAASRKKLLLIGAGAILFLGTGIGSFLAGKSSVDLKREQKVSYDSGFSAGDSVGYDRGFSEGDSAGFNRGDSAGYDRGYDAGDSAGYDRGYDSGKTVGCENVFSFYDGTYDYVAPYNPYGYYTSSKYPGRYYWEKSDC